MDAYESILFANTSNLCWKVLSIKGMCNYFFVRVNTVRKEGTFEEKMVKIKYNWWLRDKQRPRSVTLLPSSTKIEL